MADKLMIYSKIRELKADGFSQRKIARQLGVSRSTVRRYLAKDSQEFSTWLAATKSRTQKLDGHKEKILSWLRQYPDLSAAQVHDWLEERGFTGIAESTLRRYIKELREDFQIPKETHHREYEAIPDPPMGEQAQIDFGEIWVPTSGEKKVKIYVVAFVLSHSRYKYMEWWDHPYTAKDVIQAHEHAFEFFGGRPKTIVYDQDRTLFVNENYGDIIYTSEFESYKQSRRLNIHACRGADPESKGRIENVIGFIKKNFAKNRLFTDLESWNEQSLAWLRRKGNGKVHNTTKRIPAEVFKEEQQQLIPIYHSVPIADFIGKEDKILRRVHKDHTIKYQTNRYSVPKVTYHRLSQVEIRIIDQRLKVIDPATGEILADHPNCLEHGKLIQNRSHCRDLSKTIQLLIDQTSKKFSDKELGSLYLQSIKENYPRYTRDQISLLNSLFEEYSLEIMDQVLKHCLENKIITAVGFRDMAKQMNLSSRMNGSKNTPSESFPPLSKKAKEKLVGIYPEVRDLETYTALLGGKSHG